MAERLELLISVQRIRARVAALARKIDGSCDGPPPHLVVVLRGAFVFAADLVRRLTIPATIDFVTAQSYGSSIRSSGTVSLSGLERLDVAGRPVLLIEDILDTGRTTTAILRALAEERAASLAICALLRKPAAKALDLPVFGVGFDIADDFVVGYGLDYAERYRNLPAIYRLILDAADQGHC